MQSTHDFILLVKYVRVRESNLKLMNEKYFNNENSRCDFDWH